MYLITNLREKTERKAKTESQRTNIDLNPPRRLLWEIDPSTLLASKRKKKSEGKKVEKDHPSSLEGENKSRRMLAYTARMV